VGEWLGGGVRAGVSKSMSSSASVARGAASRTFGSTVRHGNRRGSWNTMPSVPCAGSATPPSKSRSSPATIRSSVVLPQPDGPTSAATFPLPRLNASSPSTWSFPPEAARKDFCLMLTSSRSRAPTGDMSFKRLHQERFDCQHDGDEGESIGQDARDVEQLERNPDLEADAVRTPEQLDNEHNLPNQRQAGAGGGSEIGCELRQYDVAHARPRPHAKHLGHVVEGA